MPYTFLIPEVIAKIFNPVVEAKVELETHPVILEVTTSKCQYNSNICKLFGTSSSLIDFDLFF